MAKSPSGLHATFDFMNVNSIEVSAGEIYLTQDTRRLLVWRGVGNDIALATNLHLNVVYRSLALLQTLGCVSKLRHGSGAAPSLYQILSAPVDHEIEMLRERSLMSTTLKLPNKYDRILDTVNRLHARMDELERRVENLEDLGRG